MIRFDIEADDNIQVPVVQPEPYQRFNVAKQNTDKPNMSLEEQTANQIKNQQRVLSGVQHEPVQAKPKSSFFDKLSNAISGKGFDSNEDVDKYKRIARYYNRERYKNLYRGYELSIRDMSDNSNDGILIKKIDKAEIQDVKLVAKNSSYMLIGYTPNQEAWDTYLGCKPDILTRSRDGEISQHNEKDLDRVGLIKQRYGPKYTVIGTLDLSTLPREEDVYGK